MTTVSIVGLGKLGASMMGAIASRGIDVIGVDISPAVVNIINDGGVHVIEPGLADLVNEHHARIKATTDYREAVLNSDITFVVVNTPSEKDGSFSTKYVERAFHSIGKALREKNTYHLVCLTSTVMPGDTRGLLPVLEHASGKAASSRTFGLCYSPEFIALGSVIRDFLNPDFVLIGEFDEKSGDTLQEFYTRVMANSPQYKRMSIENAELTKIAINTYITTKISFANMIADLCERIPGGDIDVVTDAIGTDTRIGKKYLKGGAGYGGPCFPRDNVALGALARKLGTTAPLAATTDTFNRHLPVAYGTLVRNLCRSHERVVILGASYKPDSPVTDESQGMLLAQYLRSKRVRADIMDPLVPECPVEFGKLRNYDVIVIANNDPVFNQLTPEMLRSRCTIVDMWRMYRNRLEITGNPDIRYIPIGLGRGVAK